MCDKMWKVIIILQLYKVKIKKYTIAIALMEKQGNKRLQNGIQHKKIKRSRFYKRIRRVS